MEELAQQALLLFSFAITVAVAIAVLLILEAAVVDDDTEVLELLFLMQTLKFRQIATINFRLAQDIYG